MKDFIIRLLIALLSPLMAVVLFIIILLEIPFWVFTKKSLIYIVYCNTIDKISKFI